MGLTTAAGGFVVFLLSVSGVRGQWRVTYAPTWVCATKGSTVDMHCTYTYPSPHTVDRAFWFTKSDKVPLDRDSDYTGRVEYDCYENNCTLRITSLTGRDSAQYYFRFTTPTSAFTGLAGVTLSVTELQLLVNEITVNPSKTEAKLKCQTTCTPLSFVWFKNGQEVPEQTNSYSGFLDPGDNISCALKGHEDYRSPTLYALKFPSVSVSPPGDIMEGSSVNLTCSSDANPAAKYTWYKNDTYLYTLSEEPQLVFSSIQSSDTGLYYCATQNELGRRMTEYFIDVKYAPKLPSVSVSPSAEIVEGSSVTLTCSSDANPAANYTWYKNKQTLLQGPEGIYQFSSISSEDRGIYHCKSENQYGEINSPSLYLDVQYAPKLPAVAVCPSAEIAEGSTVSLICSSDANPAATYTWYKENEDSPKASGQILVISDLRAEHSGNYYCEAQNCRGRHRFAIYLTVVAGKRGPLSNQLSLQENQITEHRNNQQSRRITFTMPESIS